MIKYAFDLLNLHGAYLCNFAFGAGSVEAGGGLADMSGKGEQLHAIPIRGRIGFCETYCPFEDTYMGTHTSEFWGCFGDLRIRYIISK